ncbi:MAG: NADH-ubiquinone oxidoreductase-F iron-sulfur binding region domain-containing protein [Actinomycetota bacterium]
MSAAPVQEPVTRRLLAGIRADGRPLSLAEHRRLHGSVDVDGRTLVELVDRSGLRGRGGGGFPTGRKLAAVRASGRRAVVVVNGAEGEPPAGKDKVLLAYQPHLVLDGAVAAAHAVRAREVVVAVNRVVLAAVERAIAERDDPKVTLRAVAVPDRFVAGEETALVQFLNGGPALPTFTPPRPFERGVRGLPTLVQNAETLAQLALIARRGPEWFRSVGDPEHPGTVLVTLSGSVREAGVYEIATGYPLSALLADAGGTSGEPQAFLVGGYFGTWIPGTAVDVPLANGGLQAYGATLGAGAVRVLPRGTSGIAETARILRYLADESAGQCGPCVYGLAAVADDFAGLASRDRHVDRDRLERRLGAIAGRGACRHPDGAVRLAASALRVFA